MNSPVKVQYYCKWKKCRFISITVVIVKIILVLGIFKYPQTLGISGESSKKSSISSFWSSPDLSQVGISKLTVSPRKILIIERSQSELKVVYKKICIKIFIKFKKSSRPPLSWIFREWRSFGDRHRPIWLDAMYRPAIVDKLFEDDDKILTNS